MFEHFSCPALQLHPAPVLSLLALGRNTGLALHLGHGSMEAIPVIEGKPQLERVTSTPFGNGEISTLLQNLLAERGVDLSAPRDQNTLDDIKKKTCFVSTQFEKDMSTDVSSSVLRKNYELPTETPTTLSISSERFRSTEVLFRPTELLSPSSSGSSSEPLKSIQQVAFDSLKQFETRTRRDLMGATSLCGGASLFPGMNDRLRTELGSVLNALHPEDSKFLRLHSPTDDSTDWLGGSMLASLEASQQEWLSRQDYDEGGPTRRPARRTRKVW